MMTEEALNSLCDNFNAMYPVGSPVILVRDGGEVTTTKTRSEAQVRNGYAVIFVDGEAGYWLLERVIPSISMTGLRHAAKIIQDILVLFDLYDKDFNAVYSALEFVTDIKKAHPNHYVEEGLKSYLENNWELSSNGQ